MSDPMTDIQKQYRKILYTALSAAACMIFGLFSLLYLVPIGVTLIVAALVIYFALYRPNRHAYSDLVNKTNLERTICRLIDSPVPEPMGGDILTDRILIDSDLIPVGPEDAAPLYCWEMKGHRKSFSISLGDTTILHRYMAGNGKNTFHTLSGVFSVIGLPSDSGRHFLIMDWQFLPDTVRELFMGAKPEYVTEPINDRDLAERYILYRSTKDIQGEMPASFLQSLKRLTNYTPGLVAISVKGDKMYVFITDRFVSQRVPLSKTYSVEDLDDDQFPELSYLFNVASTLGGGSTGPASADEEPDEQETDEQDPS